MIIIFENKNALTNKNRKWSHVFPLEPIVKRLIAVATAASATPGTISIEDSAALAAVVAVEYVAFELVDNVGRHACENNGSDTSQCGSRFLCAPLNVCKVLVNDSDLGSCFAPGACRIRA